MSSIVETSNKTEMDFNYNAVIRDFSCTKSKSLKVLARVQIADFKDYPSSYRISHNGKDIDRETTKFEDLYPTYLNPIHIYKPETGLFPLEIETLSGALFTVWVTSQDTMDVVKLRIFQIDGQYSPNIYYLAKKIGADSGYNRFMTLGQLGIEKGSRHYLLEDLRAKHALNPTVQSKKIDYRATYPLLDKVRKLGSTKQWACYGPGLNIVGTCGNPECPSVQNGQNGAVVIRMGYRKLALNLQTGQGHLKCSACLKSSDNDEAQLIDFGDNVHQFTPTGMLFSKARSLIAIRVGGKVKSIFHKNKTKASQLVEILPKYQGLQVYTVETWKSPYWCVRCDSQIEYKVQEYEMRCGHVYHSWCKPGLTKQCKICESKVFIVGSIGAMLKMV